MYDNFYYLELLILIPLVLSAFFLCVASKSAMEELVLSSIVCSVFFGVVFFVMLHLSGACLPNSANTDQAIEFLRKADGNNVKVSCCGTYSIIQYKGRVVFPCAVRRPVINYLEQQQKDQVNELIKEVIFD